MLRFVPRAAVTAAVALTAAGCASTGGAPAADADAGGRYRVLVPALEVQGASEKVGERVADDLRALIAGMATHTAVPEKELGRAMKAYNVEDLNEITARQLAQQIKAELVTWGTVASAGGGLEADVVFTDVRSGDKIAVEDVVAADPKALAQAVFQQFEQKVEGIRKAVFCNDYLSSQQFDRALTVCEEALAIVPQSTSALYGKATALVNLDRAEEALAAYQQLLEIDRMHSEALLGAGLAASNLGRSEDALGFYQRYMELNPGDVRVRMKIAGDIAKTSDYVSAYRILEPVVVENAQDLDLQRYLLQVATAAGQKVAEEQGKPAAREFFETALAAYGRVAASDTIQLGADIYRQVLAVNLALDRTQDAIAIGRTATEKFDTVASVWSVYANVLGEAKQQQEAIRALSRVIELDPDYENVYVRRGLAYMELGNRKAALADLEKAAGRGNRDVVAQVIYNMGAKAYQANDFSDAENLLGLASQYASGDLQGKINFLLGVSLYRQGEMIAKANGAGSAAQAKRALAYFERALAPLQATSEAQAATVRQAAQQYIENQRAIIKAGN